MIKPITKADAIHSLRPGAEFTLRGDSLEWPEQEQLMPTDKEIDLEVVRLAAQESNRIAEVNRKIAYAAEADPLFFRAQRGEIDQQEWLDKIAEIKAKFPKE